MAGLLVGVLLIGVLHNPTAGHAAAEDWTFEFSLYPEYSEGKYGTRHTTQILYVPLISTWAPTDRLELRLTIPFVWERGHDIFAVVGGGTVGGAQKVEARRRTSQAGVVTAQGLGDILLEAEYAILQDRGLVPEIAPFLEIKLPTADSSQGLGTGAVDETLGVSIAKAFGAGWTGHLEIWYTFVGVPAHVRLHDALGWLVGVGYNVTRSLTLAAYVEGGTTVTSDTDNPLDVRVEAEYKLGETFGLLARTSIGLTRASPDYTVSGGMRVRF
jgi:hypothetical protein